MKKTLIIVLLIMVAAIMIGMLIGIYNRVFSSSVEIIEMVGVVKEKDRIGGRSTFTITTPKMKEDKLEIEVEEENVWNLILEEHKYKVRYHIRKKQAVLDGIETVWMCDDR